jgi:O-antigen/teichoic acid export membrane protein
MIAQIFKFSLNLISNTVLARLLTPQDYGLIGMVTAVTGFVLLFKDLGLSMATVQKDEISHQQVSNLFWINLALGVVTALITIAIAPVIAAFYNEPRLIWISLALAIGFIKVVVQDMR